VETLANIVASIAGVWAPLPYVFVFVLLLACGLGLPIPEDITLFVAGLYCYEYSGNVYAMIAICFVGVMLGDSIIFALGARYGRRLLQRKFFARVLHPERLGAVEKRLKKGNYVIFLARFMPGLRAPIFFSAGVLKLPFRVFFFYDGLAAVLSVPAIVYATYHYGAHVDRVIRVIQRLEYGILGLILVLFGIITVRWFILRRRSQSTS
jgi:membrane protein DedA with SNARE-associated domain